jgi:hypothetical protein
MNTKSLFVSAIALTLLGGAIAPQIAKAVPALNEESRLGTNGIGPVIVGMTTAKLRSESFILDK